MAIGEYLVLLGALVNISCSLIATKSILQGKTRPNLITWLLWSIAPFIGAVAAVASGVTWAALPVFAAGFSPFIILMFSFFNKKAYWKLTMFDYLCGVLSLLALLFWVITKEPVVAIVFAIMSDAFAAIPTIKKSWSHPESENSLVYIGGGFNALTSFFVIKTWTFSEYAFPIYLVILCFGILFLMYRKKIFKK